MSNLIDFDEAMKMFFEHKIIEFKIADSDWADLGSMKMDSILKLKSSMLFRMKPMIVTICLDE